MTAGGEGGPGGCIIRVMISVSKYTVRYTWRTVLMILKCESIDNIICVHIFNQSSLKSECNLLLYIARCNHICVTHVWLRGQSLPTFYVIIK